MPNVVRKDVVQISFDVNDDGLTRANKEVDNFKKSITNGLGSGLDKFKQSVDGIKKSVKGLGDGNSIAKMKNDIETANAALSVAKDKFNAVSKAVKGIAAHPIETLDKKILALQMSTGRAKAEFKNLAKTKIDNLKSKISEVKNVLTEGQTGAKGFGNALKNIGKIGLGKTISDFSNLKSNLSNLKNSVKQFIPGVQQLNDKLSGVTSKLSEIAKKAAGPVFSGLKKVAALSFKGLAMSIGAVATGLGAAVTQSVKGFADYEQLVGGVETLFKNSAGTVQKYANDAYKTAGLSANRYMETVTSFSASLLQGLGGDTEKAAQYAHTAVVDMADNANKMGTDIEMIQNAYQGFAKQNYTMLDNLKLGYGGTKTEMQRLIKEAANMKDIQEELGVSVDGTSMSFDNIVNAIHVVQKNLDIMGTTAKEAEGTIQGSLFAMKSAWENLLVAMGSGENLDQCFDNMISSVEIFGNNLMPVAERALAGIGTVIEKLAPTISEKFPELAQKLIPPLISATTTMVGGLIRALPSIIGTIIKEIPNMAKQLGQAIGGLFDNISQGGDGSSVFGSIFSDMKDIIADVAATLGNLTKKLVEFFSKKSTLDAMKRTWDMIKIAIKGVLTIVTPLINFLANNLSWIAPLIMSIVSAILILKGVILAVTIVIKIITLVQWAFNAAMTANPITWIIIAIVALIAIIVLCIVYWDKIKAAAVKCWEAIKSAWGAVCSWFNQKIIQPVANAFKALWNGIKAGVQAVLGFFKSIGTFIYTNVIQPIVNFFKGLVTAILVIVLGIVGLICQGFLKIVGWINTYVIQPIVGFFKMLWNGIKAGVLFVWNIICSIWGAISNWINSNIIQPVVTGFNILWNKIKSGVQFIWNTICNVWGAISGWVNTNIIQPVVGFFKTLWNGIKDIANGIKDCLVNAFKVAWDKVTGVWDGLKNFFKGIWNGLKDTGGALKDTLVNIWKKAVSAIAKPVNKLIGGANWVLKKLGSEKRVAEWKPYAKGTDGHPGGNALVNDGRGAELVQMPNGNTFIPRGRNVFLPNAPRGMKVLPAEQTAHLLGRKSPTFNYAEGTGDFDIWNFFDNAKGLVGKIVDKFVSFKDVTGYTLDAGKAMISTAKDAMSNWITKLFDKFGGKSIGSYVASAGVEQWRSTVIQALKMEGLYSEANVKRTLYQMQTESGGNPRAINLWDSNAKKGIPSKGLMQCIDPTFKAYARPGFDKNIYDPLSNILASIRYARARYGSLERAYRGVGYANGGIATKPSIFGESGAEMAIPLKKSKRRRALDLWNETGERLGVSTYTPEGDAKAAQTNNVENNTYAPVFNLTISGSNDDRMLARKVKRWISEALDEQAASMARRTKRLQEA